SSAEHDHHYPSDSLDELSALLEIPSLHQVHYPRPSPHVSCRFSGGLGVAFKLLKRGNRGKMEAQEVVVPASTSLAAQVNRNEEASREESSIIKARV
ncbi:unnamed protein product, partial [Scytosiphon promiscuus]